MASVCFAPGNAKLTEIVPKVFAVKNGNFMWQEQPFICGKSPVYPEKTAQERSFSQGATWGVFFARTSA